MLNIKNLSVKVNEKNIIKNLDLNINDGEIHAIMGPNGTGKSSLSKVIMGEPNYVITKGTITYDGEELNNLPVNIRANKGIFLAMQTPSEIEGVTNADFLRTALHSKEGNEFNLMKFIKELDNTAKKLNIDSSMIHRDLNVGFSGGEKKKNEILQMNILKPKLIILDEIDSGLDVDSLKLVANEIKNYYKESKPAILLISHYKKLLDYIKPEFVHIMNNGRIVESGDYSLIKKVDEEGYASFGDKLE